MGLPDALCIPLSNVAPLHKSHVSASQLHFSVSVSCIKGAGFTALSVDEVGSRLYLENVL